MSTLTLTRDQLATELRAGDRLTAIDGAPLARPHEVLAVTAGDVALVNYLGTATEWHLYPDTHVGRDVTVERPDQKPAVEAVWDKRERTVLRRSPGYVALLELLDVDHDRGVDFRSRYTPNPPTNYGFLAGASEAKRHQYGKAGDMSQMAGTVSTFYGWVEKVAPYTFRLTPRGRSVLAAWRAHNAAG